MKRCEYCAKNISYHEMYCSDECEKAAKDYYHKRVKTQKLISFCYIVGTAAIAIAIFLYALPPVQILSVSLAMFGGYSTGLITLLIPTPTDNIIEKHKIKKAMSVVRLFSIILFAFAIAATVLLFTIIF